MNDKPPPRSRVRRLALPVALAVLLLLAIGVRAGEAWMFDPSFREGSPGEVLVEGPPPLLRAHLDAFVDLTEAAFDLAMPAQLEQDLRDALETAYGGGDAAERDGLRALVLPLASLRARARSGDVDGMREGLSAYRLALDHRLRAVPDRPAYGHLRRALELRRKVSWPGDPPVYGGAATAWLEMAEFVASLGRNEDVQPTVGQRTALQADLAARFHGLPSAQRAALAKVHRVWLRLKARWDTADIAKRLPLRWEAVTLLARMVPPSRGIVVAKDGDLRGYAKAAAVLKAVQPGFEAWTNLARNPELVLKVLDEWLGPVPAGGDHILLYR